MKTFFDKIYVLSLIQNKSRQEFIKEQFKDLDIDFEFIYGIDYFNLRKDYKGDIINWPKTYETCENNKSGSFGCTLAHYQAVLQAYEFNYNNVLIIEDDICFIKDKETIEYFLNNIPEDADFISYSPRFIFDDLFNNFGFFSNIKNIIIKNKEQKWITLNQNTIGGMMYGLMNRKIMNLYLKNQRNSLKISDQVNNIFINPHSKIKRYIPTYCLCTDQYNIKNSFNKSIEKEYENIYINDNNYNINDFYIPKEYSLFTRYV